MFTLCLIAFLSFGAATDHSLAILYMLKMNQILQLLRKANLKTASLQRTKCLVSIKCPD